MVDTRARRVIDEDRMLSHERLINWCIWKVALPLGMLLLLWPLYETVPLKYPFESAFAHGDLILFAVLILLEAAVEGDHIRAPGIWRTGMNLARLGAIFLVVVYCVVKMDVVQHFHDVPDASSAQGMAGAVPAAGPDLTKAARPAAHLDLVKTAVPVHADMILHRMHFYSSLNWIVAIVAVIASLLAYWTAISKEYEERLAKLAEEAA